MGWRPAVRCALALSKRVPAVELIGQPAEGGDNAPSVGRHGGRLKNPSDASLIPPGKRQIGASKRLPRLRMGIELFERELPTIVARNDEAVEVGVETLIQLRQFPSQVVRLTDGRGPDVPEEGSFFSVLGNDGWDDSHVVQTRLSRTIQMLDPTRFSSSLYHRMTSHRTRR